jgi:protein SCO1/2
MSKIIRTTWAACGVVIVVILGLVGYKLATTDLPANTTTSRSATTTITTTPVGGPFTLVDETGAVVTEQSYGDKYRLVFFGFTHCPAICPAELLKIADVLTLLGPKANQIVPLFVTIDPKRDTPAIMRAYTDQFDPRIIGLTGSADQIAAAVKSFKVYAARVETESDYTMDHSTLMYLTGPDHIMQKAYKMDDTAEMIAADLKQRLP